MSKIATKAYRVYRTERVTKEGELVPTFRQKKQQLTSAEHVRLFHMIKHLHIDHLVMGGGAGALILRRAKRAALRSLKEPKRVAPPWRRPRRESPASIRVPVKRADNRSI